MTYTVKITGFGNDVDLFFIVWSTLTSYTSAQTMSLDAGESVAVYTKNPVTWDGEVVQPGGTSGNYYDFTITSDLTIDLSASGVTITTGILPDDPLAPHDGHNTMSGNTAYQLESGTVLLNGVACEIELGMTLVGGVAYEIPFAKPIRTVTITGEGNINVCYVTINGTKYYEASTLEVEAGTIIDMYVTGRYGSSTGTITLNGTTVASGRPAEYAYTATGDVTIAFRFSEYGSSSISITET